MMKKLAVAIIALTLSSVLHAAEVGGVKLDDKTSRRRQELVLNGAGVRTRAIFKVYVASLYVPEKTADPASVWRKARAESSSTCCAHCPPTSWPMP